MIYFLIYSRIDLSDCYIAYDQTSYDCMTGSQDFHYNLIQLNTGWILQSTYRP